MSKVEKIILIIMVYVLALICAFGVVITFFTRHDILMSLGIFMFLVLIFLPEEIERL